MDVKKLRRFCVGSAQPKDESEMETFMRLASNKDVDIFCFPEGFLKSRASIERLSKLTKECGMWIVTGYSESEEGYQSALILNENGEIVGKHRKTSLANSEVREGKMAGNDLDVFETKFGKIGVVICAEILCPEVTRVLALKGAEIIFHLIGVGMDGQVQYDLWKSIIQIRAIENLLYFVTSTNNQSFRKGEASLPLGLIVNSGGQILAETGKGNLIYSFINLEEREKDARKGTFHKSYSKMISRRQPKLYSLLATQ
jgi:predicted amidohydrolase